MIYLAVCPVTALLLFMLKKMPGFVLGFFPSYKKDRKDKLGLFLTVLLVGDIFALFLWISKGGEAEHVDKTVFFLGLIAAGASWFLFDYDLQKRNRERKKQMEAEYPAIVSKLSLYLGAGMNLNKAFAKTAREGVQKKNPNPVYEEMQLALGEMADGITEADSYIRFGKRTGLQRYIRLGTLLTQNLKKGNAVLLVQLKNEAFLSMQEHTAGLRKTGEEMGTKLLLPMLMMMGMTMMLIIVPAFLSF